MGKWESESDRDRNGMELLCSSESTSDVLRMCCRDSHAFPFAVLVSISMPTIVRLVDIFLSKR